MPLRSWWLTSRSILDVGVREGGSNAGLPKWWRQVAAGTGRIPFFVTTLMLHREHLLASSRYPLAALFQVHLDTESKVIPEGTFLFLDPRFANPEAVFAEVPAAADAGGEVVSALSEMGPLATAIWQSELNQIALYRFFGPEEAPLTPEARAEVMRQLLPDDWESVFVNMRAIFNRTSAVAVPPRDPRGEPRLIIAP
jgi:hypothetical protein